MDSNNQTKDLQLENETPMDLTVKFEEPLEPKPFSIAKTEPVTQPTPSITPAVEPTPSITPALNPAEQLMASTSITPNTEPINQAPQTTNPIEQIVNVPNPLKNLEFSKSNDISNTGIQKIVIILGAVLGVVIVVGVGFFLLSNNNQPNIQNTTQVNNVVESAPIAPTVTPTLTVVAVLPLAEYQAVISEIETNTNTILVKYPINLSQNKIDPESVRFASEELFSNYQKIVDLKTPEGAKASNEKLAATYQTLYQSYDLILKTFKENNIVTPEAKTKFTADYNQAQSNLKAVFLEIKNLK